ncbi:YceI family protein [Tunicatimonas pelagia]|uniref:YceI family protein n=1 Tax=Tunicatimonas pelagia TaxID=931531 RepID=UPI0026669E0A|nr:YceI family protein [Tunicatimonas pelagia]WKN42599.1 YceI family protein [Tunicatimonas pelagia]
MKKQLFFLLLILPTAFAFPIWNTWSISDDYEVRFSGSGAEGTFRGLTGTVVFNPDQLGQAQFDVSVDATTIDTGNKTKDKHARGKDWFDVEQYPEIKFRSSQITKVGEQYQMTGTLTLHGTEKEITFPFTFTENGSSGLFEGSFTVDREEYGIEGPFISFMVGDDFEVSLKVPVQSSSAK